MRSRPTPRKPVEQSDGSSEGWAVVSTLLGGFLVWGGIGWLLDRWFETRFLTPIGLIVGMALGIYAVVARAGLPGATPKDAVKTDHRVPPAPAGARRESQ